MFPSPSRVNEAVGDSSFQNQPEEKRFLLTPAPKNALLNSTAAFSAEIVGIVCGKLPRFSRVPRGARVFAFQNHVCRASPPFPVSRAV